MLELLRGSSEARPLEMGTVDLRELLDDLREVVNYEAPAGTPGIVVSCAGPLEIPGDRELLWRAIENLLRNALMHTRPDFGVQVEAVAYPGGSTVELCVRDAGPGVPASQLGKIFEPFYRVQEARERKTGGHGLGLAIAASAIRRHGGSIEARNAETGGLEIRVLLPLIPLRPGPRKK